MSGKRRSLPGADDITRIVLPNGIVVLCRANFNSPSVVLSGSLPAGGLFDADEKLGLADFVAASLMRGTRKRDFHRIHDDLESIGASFGFRGRTRSVGFGGRALAEDLPLLLDILSEGLRQPTFPADQVERLRAQLLTALSLRAQDTDDMASLTFDQIAYAGHPYRRPEDGYPETVQAITRDDLLAFHERHYGPNGMILAIVGALEPQTVIRQVQEAFADWQNPAQPDLPPLPPLQPLAQTVREHHVIAGKAQVDIVMGVAGPRRKDEAYLAASLGNSVLGQFGLMGRIGDSVRERSGLAYYAYSSLSAGIGPGAWYVSAGVNPANAEKAIALITEELARFVEDGVSADELADSQANFIGRLPLSLESNGGVAGALLNIERYDLGLDYYRLYPALVRAVTPPDVLAAARQYLDPARLVVASAGPVLP
jgi:zinc protease